MGCRSVAENAEGMGASSGAVAATFLHVSSQASSRYANRICCGRITGHVSRRCMKTRLLAIDGQPLLYRSYFQRTGRTLHTKDGFPSGGFYGFLRSVLALKQRFPDAHMAFA